MSNGRVVQPVVVGEVLLVVIEVVIVQVDSLHWAWRGKRRSFLIGDVFALVGPMDDLALWSWFYSQGGVDGLAFL